MIYHAKPVTVYAKLINQVDGPFGNGSYSCVLEDGTVASASAAMVARYVPKPGDYWVTQTDGYAYLNPKAVFERKYSPGPGPMVTE